MKQVSALTLSICICLTSCGGNGHSEEEYQKLKQENALLSQQIEQYQNSPERLLESAKTYLDNKNYSGATAILRDLIQRNPDSKPAKAARKLLPSAVSNAKKAEWMATAKKAKVAIEQQSYASDRIRIEAKIREKIDACMGYTKVNRRGATEYTFNATEFKKRITKEGFRQLGGEYSNDYKGQYQGHPVTIKHGGATASANGWEQHWDVSVD